MTAGIDGGRRAVLQRTTVSKAQRVKQPEDRCRRDEESGSGALRGFSRTLRRYDSLSGDMK
jgi:stearoyl-CoA desaturase (delta-9 desaturase)